MDDLNFAPLEDKSPSEDQPDMVAFQGTSNGSFVARDPEAVAQRATKYDFALGDKSPGVTQITDRINSGLEDSDRQSLAIDKSIQLHDVRTAMIKNMSATAAQEGRNLTEAETSAILDLSNLSISNAVNSPDVPKGTLAQDPNTILEREYASKVLQHAVDTGEDTPYSHGVYWDQEGVHQRMDIFDQTLTLKEGYQKLAEEMDSNAKGQSWLGWGADMAKGLIPGYSYFKTKGLLRDTQDISAYGTNLLDTVHAAYNGKPEETLPYVQEKLRQLSKDNPALAATVAHALVDYPSSAKLLDNILVTGTDLATVLPFGAIAKGGTKLADLAKAGVKAIPEVSPSAAVTTAKGVLDSGKAHFDSLIKSIGSTVLRKDVTLPEVLDSAGKVPESAVSSVIDKISRAYGAVGAKAEDMKQFLNELPGIFNAREVTGGIRSTWATGLTSKMLEDLMSDADTGLKRLFMDAFKTDRFGPKTLNAAMDVAAGTFKIERRDLEHSIMNVFHNNMDEGLGEHQAVIHLGDETAMPFETKEQAANAAKLYGLDDASNIVPAGNKYAIQIQRPLDFTKPSVRDAMKVDAKDSPTPWSNVLGNMLTSLRSGDDILPKSVVQKLKQATYGGSGLERLIVQSAKRIGKLKDNKDFLSFIKSEMMERNPAAPEKLGGMSKDPQEFEVKFNQKMGRIPTEQEKAAYFGYRFINDMHYAAMNLSLYLDKSAIGLSRLNFDELGNDAFLVEGKVSNYKELMDINENARVMVLEKDKDPKFVNTHWLGKKDAETDNMTHGQLIDHLVNEKGYIVSKITDTGDNDLREIFNQIYAGTPDANPIKGGRVSFVVTKDVKAKPLSPRQINYQPGIHNIMPDGHYISQPDIFLSEGKTRKIARYYGDRNTFFVGSEKMSKDVAAKMEEFRRLYNEMQSFGKKVDPLGRARAFRAANEYAKKNLPVSFKQLAKDFKSGVLKSDVPFMARASNQSLHDAHPLPDMFPNADYVRHSDSELNFYRGRVNLEFATKRGDPIREVVNRGDPAAPVYGLRQANLLDPMAALDRGVSAMVRGRYFEPIKVDIAERFLSEFGDLLNSSNKQQMLDPFRALKEQDFKTNIQGEDLQRLRMAKAYAARANQFFGNVVNQETKFWKYMGQKLVGDTDPAAMSAWRQSLADILKEGHPADIIKKLAFYPKMGFWNPKQLLQQGNTYANVVALAGPVIGGKAGVFSILMRMGMIDDKLIPELANKAAALGFNKEEFIRIAEAMDRSGFAKMGREVATREQHLEGRVVQTALGGIMDHGLFFMREGEEFVRRASFAAAFLEKEAAKGARKLTDNDLQEVLNRADFYNVNMSHASNAAWQQGFASIPTQFWSYQIRLMEQLVGKRMTWQERASLLGTYSFLYGVPIGLTTAMPIWPVHESIKEYLISKNIDTNTSMISKVLNDGILSNLVEMVGGVDTNIENVYGPSGVPLFKDLMDGKKGVLDTMTGASGNVVFNTLASIAPAIEQFGAYLMGMETVPLKAQDFVDVLNSISTVSTMEKMYIAMTTQKYLTKYGQEIGAGDSVTHMLFNTILGVQPQAIDDMYRTMQVNEDYKSYIKKLNKWVQEDVHNALSATNPADRTSWWKRAQVKRQWFPNELDANEAISAAVIGSKNLIEQSRQQHARQSEAARLYEIKKRNYDASGVK